MPALLVIDVMNHFGFPGGAALGAQVGALRRRIRLLRARFDQARRPVI